MTCLLVVAWATIFSIMVRAVILKDILWPQKQEDREEGGWKAHPNEKRACDPRGCDEPNSRRLPSTVIGQQPAVEHAENVESPGTSEPQDGNADLDGSLPAIAEKLIEEPVRGRNPRKNDSMV